MAVFPPPLARVIQELSKLPGIGEKTATRLAFHLVRTDRSDVDALARALTALREDRGVLASVVLFAIGTLVTLYVPEVQELLQRLFYHPNATALP